MRLLTLGLAFSGDKPDLARRLCRKPATKALAMTCGARAAAALHLWSCCWFLLLLLSLYVGHCMHGHCNTLIRLDHVALQVCAFPAVSVQRASRCMCPGWTPRGGW